METSIISTLLLIITFFLVLFSPTQANSHLPSGYFKIPNSTNGTAIKPRIIGGKEAAPHSIPYQVALFLKVWGQNEKIFCGGSLLNEIFILTAAHCIVSSYEAEVILGAHNILEIEPTQQRFTTKIFMVHRGWNPFTLRNDIGIVRLPRPADYTSAVQPIQLPRNKDRLKSFSFKTATVSGWGITADGATSINPVLRQMQSRITLPLVCKIYFFGNTGKNQICINGYHRKSACDGDSGGPLVISNRNGEPVQQGIVSFRIGFGCEKGWPQVFTKVSRYLKWIWEHTGIGEAPSKKMSIKF